jgi:hypothetical protein
MQWNAPPPLKIERAEHPTVRLPGKSLAISATAA